MNIHIGELFIGDRAILHGKSCQVYAEIRALMREYQKVEICCLR